MLEAARGLEARVVLTRALDDGTRVWARTRAADGGVGVHETDAASGALRVLDAFDAALCASGTASLECAMASVPPVVAYRVDALAAFVARRALRTPHVALPNVILGRRAFPELLQDDARAERMRRALDELDIARARADCGEVRRRLGEGHVPSRADADMIEPWL
jgi:lipid-A-disaccharide synthase